MVPVSLPVVLVAYVSQLIPANVVRARQACAYHRHGREREREREREGGWERES